MKTMTLFELGYLDLFKALFLGKKINLVHKSPAIVDARESFTAAPDLGGPRGDVAGYDPVTNQDPDWNPGRMWTDPYHVNPFTEDPFERV